MAFATTIINQSVPANIPTQIRQLFVTAAWEGLTIGSLVSGTNCEYFVMEHISGAEILVQAPINTSTRSNPTFFASASYPSNHALICLASADSTASMWTRLYTDSLLPNNASFWTDVTSTPCLVFPEFFANQGDIDFDVHFRDSITDFDMLWITRNEGVVVGIKGSGVISTQLSPGVYGIVTWFGNNTTGNTEGALDVAINPLDGGRLGEGSAYSAAFSAFRDPRSQVRTLTASMLDNSATQDRSQTVPLYVNGRILGTMNPDLIRFCRTTLTRNQSWSDPDNGRGFTTCGDGLMIGNLTADPVYVGV